MNKLKTLLIAFIATLTLLSGTVSAASVKLSVNGTAVNSPSFIQQGTTFFGLRELLNALGVGQINWNAKTQTVTAVKGDTTVIVTVGKKQVYLNGKLYKQLEVPAQSTQNKVYLPARAVAEAFGYAVKYDSKTSTVVLTSGTASSNVNNSAAISIPDLDNQPSYKKKALDKLSVKLKGGKLEIIDIWAGDLNIQKIQIMDYTKTMTTPLPISPGYEGIAVDLASFTDDSGNTFEPTDGEMYFINLITDAGSIVRSETYLAGTAAKDDEAAVDDIKYGYMGSPITLEGDSLVGDFSPKPAFMITQIKVEDSYTYTPASPITIDEQNQSFALPLAQFKNTSGESFKATTGWRQPYKVTIVTNYGEFSWSL